MNKKLWISFFSLASISCMALDLDSEMTSAEKKKTGYDSLTKAQKKELNLWLTKNTTLVQKDKAEDSSLSLNINIEDGRELILSDGTKWEVAREDRHISSVWLTPIPLKILPSGSKEYPQILQNVDSPNEKVKVRPLH